jgi:hypothetical protein
MKRETQNVPRELLRDYLSLSAALAMAAALPLAAAARLVGYYVAAPAIPTAVPAQQTLVAARGRLC